MGRRSKIQPPVNPPGPEVLSPSTPLQGVASAPAIAATPSELRKHLEERKLALEIRQLERPFWRGTSFWFSFATAIFAVVGVVYQSQLSSLDRKDAEISRKVAEFETAKAKELKEELDRGNRELLERNQELVAKNNALDQVIRDKNATIAKQREDLDSLVAQLLTNEQLRRKAVQRFTIVVGPLLEKGFEVEVIAYDWGTFVAYEALLELEGKDHKGVVGNFFTVGSPLSIATVRDRLDPTARTGKKPAVVRRWTNLNARGDIVGGSLASKGFLVDEEFLNLQPFGCSTVFLGVTNPTCAHASYFQPGNDAVNRDILGKIIAKSLEQPLKRIVYVHGAGLHLPGYSDPWWSALEPFAPSLAPGRLGEERFEVYWSDLANSKSKSGG